MFNIDENKLEDLKPKTVMYAQTPNELSYQIYILLLEYIKYNGRCYKKLSDIIGCLEMVKIEIYSNLSKNLWGK